MLIQLTTIVSRAKSIRWIPKKVKKLALNSQLLTVQILKNDVQVLILCLSYFITTVIFFSKSTKYSTIIFLGEPEEQAITMEKSRT